MINLLPTHARRVVYREHTLRLLAVFFLALSFASLILFFVSLPTWLMLRYQTVGEEKDQELLEKIAAERVRAEKELVETQQIIEHLSKKSTSHDHTSIIEMLDQIAGEEISINQFNFDAKDKLIVTGIADTRSGLSAFRNRVEASSYFKEVELPLASLVRESDAVFTMTLTLK